MKSSKIQFENASCECMDAIYTRAIRLTKNAPEAEKLVQLTFLRAFKAFDELKRMTDFKSRLMRILNDIYHERSSASNFDTLTAEQEMAAAH